MITLPNEIVILISAGIGFLVTNGLKSLFPNWDIQGTAAQITVAIVTCVVALANQGLTFIPVQYHQVVLTAFTLIISILGAYGVHYSLNKQKSLG